MLLFVGDKALERIRRGQDQDILESVVLHNGGAAGVADS